MEQKAAQEKRTPPRRAKARMEAYPDYSKSLVLQRHPSPFGSAVRRGTETGTVGAVLGALIARLISQKPGVVLGGAAAGGIAGAIPGAISGAREAKSDYSRLLFLRRRMGINEPGELEALLQHPEVSSAMIQKEGAEKRAAIPVKAPSKILTTLLAPLAAGAGWLTGSEGTSRMLGYHDDPIARHFGGGMNALTFATALALARHNPKALASFFSNIKGPASLLGMEAVPVGVRTLRDVAGSTAEQAKGQIAPTVQRLLQTSTARGAGVGAGLAGLTAIATGLSRPRTEDEIRKDKGRAGMVGSDFLKYLLPAAVGGGVVGSMTNR